MGTKGDKMTQDAALTAELIVGKLESISNITSKKMFGGFGIFHDGKMFGIIDSQGKAFLKDDDTNKADFESKGAEQHSKMPYFSIPDNVIKDSPTLIKWAEKSIAIAK